MKTQTKVSAKNETKVSTAKTAPAKKAASTSKKSPAKKSETKPPVSKAEQVRLYLKKNPELTNQEIVNKFKEKDITIYWSQVDGARKVMNKEATETAK